MATRRKRHDAPATETPRLDRKFGRCPTCRRGATHFHATGFSVTWFGCETCKVAWPQPVRVNTAFAGYAVGAALEPDSDRRQRTLSALREHRAELDSLIEAVQA
jgi:hypothetical protein